MAEHNRLGNQGEDLAVQHLEKQGYTILERNWHNGKEEVDIICTDQEFIVFVEVKTRSTEYFGQPEAAVNRRKRKILIRLADAYVNIHDIQLDVRYDIISILSWEGGHKVRHIEDAFYPTV
jgi:putative endonuclease